MTAVIAIELGDSLAVGTAIWAGVLGALAMLAVIYMGRASGMTSMDLLKTLGTMMMPKAEGATAYLIGLMMHLMMGAVFGLIHTGIIQALDPSSNGSAIVIAIVLGLIHGAMVTMMMPMMLNMGHPLFKDGTMPAPGTAMTGFGQMTPMGMVIAHVAFALVATLIYI